VRHLLALAGLVAAFVFLAPVVSSHEWYDQDCCDTKDCYELPIDAVIEEREHGLFYALWISPLTGDKIEGIVRPENVRWSKDGKLHGCESSYGTPRCIYINRGA
jgi:hypothetical protein